MSVLAYTGRPGSGKSYASVANQIIPALEAGRVVCTNIPLNLEAIRDHTDNGVIQEIDIKAIQEEPELLSESCPPGSIVILDEIWRLWPSGLKTNNIPETWKAFLAEHRHRVDQDGNSMQIILVTQDLSQVAVFARTLVEQTFMHTKLDQAGLSKSFRTDIYDGPVGGTTPPSKSKIREIVGRYDPKYFPFYQSHTLSQADQAGANEAKIDDRGSIWKRTSVLVGAAFALLALVYGWNALANLQDEYGGSEASEASPAPPDTSPGPTFSSQPVTRPEPRPAPVQTLVKRDQATYRVIGTVENHEQPGQSIAVITDGKRTHFISLDNCSRTDAGAYRCTYNGASFDYLGTI